MLAVVAENTIWHRHCLDLNSIRASMALVQRLLAVWHASKWTTVLRSHALDSKDNGTARITVAAAHVLHSKYCLPQAGLLCQ